MRIKCFDFSSRNQPAVNMAAKWFQEIFTKLLFITQFGDFDISDYGYNN